MMTASGARWMSSMCMTTPRARQASPSPRLRWPKQSKNTSIPRTRMTRMMTRRMMREDKYLADARLISDGRREQILDDAIEAMELGDEMLAYELTERARIMHLMALPN